MAKKQQRRSSYLSVPQTIELERTPITVWGYDQAGEFVCRVGINGAGLAVFSGAKGRKKLCDVTWEKLVAMLQKPE